MRIDQIADPQNRPVDWDDPALDFAHYSTSGVIGDPTHATAELGADLWQALVPICAQFLIDIAGTPLD